MADTGCRVVSKKDGKTELEVESRLHHLIVGKGGATIKELKSSTKTTITLPPRDSSSSIITIEGDDKNRDAAVKKISEIVDSHLKTRKKEDKKREKEYEKKKEGEEKVSQATGAKYQKEQKKVDALCAERAELFEKAEKAFKSGDKATAKELSAKGNALAPKIEEAKERAGNVLFSDRNPKGVSGKNIDLHGLQVEFAMKKVEEFLSKAKKKNLKDAEIITGAGNHSTGGNAKIKPEVEKYL
eukprot:CAMPEP_0201489520 /NCGR_PEP_ID=MMETSP0151_2-20130828/22854_1 /ASSEMBLY_ACC=CAM_ASM_000257 /TAXON_ID=200890 /ORGANISM="Paramoeba atlantica, Strain 621/1 / CCAP 1560/9" /LENGTH=241 /DNA_ID=CAMNT_0047875139 /DNA_START=20 /DNA_END=742 /DNA_ORIENTATION=-